MVAHNLPLVSSNEFHPLFPAGVVDGLVEQVRVALRSDRLLDLFFLSVVKLLGNKIFEVKGYLRVLQQGTVLGVDLILRDVRTLEVEMGQVGFGPSAGGDFSNSRVIIQLHIGLDFRQLSGRVVVEAKVSLASRGVVLHR